MPSNLKILFISFVALMSITVTAQTTSHVVKGKITEKVMAQVLVNKLVNNKRQQVAEFQISPANPNFMFALTGDTLANYQLQFNLLKTGTRHPEVKKTFLVSWSLDSRKDYSFIITPSKLDSTQKK